MSLSLGTFASRYRVPIVFLAIVVALGGVFAAMHMPSALFPQTDFPRIVIMAENGVMPADEMMATITRPVEEALKDIQGAQSVRSSTGRGTAQVDVFFSWDTDMRRAELDAKARMAQVADRLPPSVSTNVYRMTFSTFPIIGLSLTSDVVSPTDQWEYAQYTIKPRIMQIPGVSSVEILGGPEPEYTISVDPLKLAALKLDMRTVIRTLQRSNLIAPAGLHQEDNRLFLTVTDGRLHGVEDIEKLPIAVENKPVPIGDFAQVTRGPAPATNIVTANGHRAVLLNVYSQPDASTLDIAAQLRQKLDDLHAQMPAAMHLDYFYDQSLLVHSSVRGVWDAIIFGLILSVLILYLFLKDWRMTLTAIVVIPVTVLATVLVMKACGQSFNLMTLGGIAAAIGLVIDDAIVVVEAIYAKRAAGMDRLATVESALHEILPPLVGSTLTPVVVFIPLAFLTGIAGVFFRALAITMVVSLIMSLLLALFLTPTLAVWVLGDGEKSASRLEGGFILRRLIALYERVVDWTLTYRWLTLGVCLLVLFASATGYTWLKTDFLPKIDEGGFIIDYVATAGTSLEEIDRQMRQAETVLHDTPEIESYSRRTGAALGVGLVEPNTGDFLVKLKAGRNRSSDEIISDVRQRLRERLPRIGWEFPGILTDLIGDLTWTDEAIEIKIFSNDPTVLKDTGNRVEERIENIPGLVDVSNGLLYTGPSVSVKVRPADAERFGLNTRLIAYALSAAMQGEIAGHVMEGDHIVHIRVKTAPDALGRIGQLGALPIRVADGKVVRVDQVADLALTEGQLELHRDNLRQMVAVTANLQNMDLGTAMSRVHQALDGDTTIPKGTIEYGGLYQQQQESFTNLIVVLLTALALVFTVALLHFRTFGEAAAIVFGAALSVFGMIAALLITGTTLNIVTFLGAIIGMGIVHKNGLLMMDHVKRLRAQGTPLRDALIQSGRRRLRPVLMTSLAAALGMLPLAWGFGSAQMLRPLAITVIGAVAVSVLLSLVATPTVYYLLAGRSTNRKEKAEAGFEPANN